MEDDLALGLTVADFKHDQSFFELFAEAFDAGNTLRGVIAQRVGDLGVPAGDFDVHGRDARPAWESRGAGRASGYGRAA